MGIRDRNRLVDEVLRLIQDRQTLVVDGVLYDQDLQPLATLRPTNITLTEIERQFPDLSLLSFKATEKSLNATL